MRLTAKLVSIVFLVVVVLTCVSGFLTIRQQFTSFQQGREAEARKLKRQIAQRLEQAWREGGREGAREALSDARWEVRRTRIRWVQFNAQADHPDAPSAPPGSLQRVIQGEIESVVARGGDDQDWLHTYLPIITSDDQASAGVELSESLEPLHGQRRRAVLATLLTLFALGVSCVVVVLLAGVRLVGRPLERLTKQANQIGQGDFSQSITIGGRDELSQLAAALNETCAQLRRQQESLEAETASRIATLNQLRHADRLKTVGRLAAGVAHELGTPLNVIAGRAGLIGGEGLSDEEIQQSAAAIKQETDRITGIIRQLLDFARPHKPRRRPTDPRVVVSRTVQLLETLAESQQVRLEFRDDAATVVADVDEGQIQQVLTNLIMNGIHSIQGSGAVTVSVGARDATRPDQPGPAAAFAYIEIADSGAGIAPEHRERIFEPFFTTKPVGDGTGLGLSIAHGIVQEHDGWIDVQSEPGRGSCFTIYLPLSEEPPR